MGVAARSFRTQAVSAASSPLVLDGVHKRWPGQEQAVLADVSLSLASSTLTWIGGRNGAGKTTLLRIASGLILPDKGSVRVCGLDIEIERRESSRRVGFLSAGNTGLYARLAVREHMEFGARIGFLAGVERRQAIARSLTRFGLDDLAPRRVDRLSMGQRQRVRLAIALLHEPLLVLLDEPRTSLDEDGEELLASALTEVTARGGAVLWCSPSIRQEGVAFDHCLRLENGRLEPA